MTNTMNVQEFFDEVDRQRREFERKALAGQAKWGAWGFDPRNLTLQLDPQVIGANPDWFFEIDLEQPTGAAEILDWLCEVAYQDDWIPREQLWYLLSALDELAGGLQSAIRQPGFDLRQRLMSFGKGMSADDQA